MTDAHTAASHVTPYDRHAWSDEQVEAWLASGAHREELRDHFGTAAYAELTLLARRARRRDTRGAPRVFMLPGIMGSQLGVERGARLPNDILWIDPIDIAAGRLRELVVRPHSPVRAMGVLLFTHLKLKLHLRIAGFAPRLIDYDWRLGLEHLGNEFAATLARETGAPSIVAHSMGGLVARAALALPRTDHVRRLVMLATPNLGSFAPVQALRGTYAVVRKIATLDLRHSAETLASEVFASFPSLYEMLPAPGITPLDLFDAANWPVRGPRPDEQRLAAARGIERALLPGDERMVIVAGHGRETPTGIARRGADFDYTITRAGDGTVPLSFALLPGVRTYFVRGGHSDIPRSDRVALAVVDILRKGETQRLPATPPPARRAAGRIGDRALRRTYRYKLDWSELSAAQRRKFLENLNDSPSVVLAVPTRRGTRASPTRPLWPARLVVELSRGDIETANADALVVAIFQGVRPAGAALAIDARLDGALVDLAERRMLSGEAGRVSSLPAGGRLPHARHVLITGIGRFDRLNEATIDLAAANVARFCNRARIRTLATVPWGAGAGFAPEVSFAAQLRGYLRGRADRAEGGLERITVCVHDAAAYRSIAAMCRRLALEVAMADAGLIIREAQRRKQRVTHTARPAATVPRVGYLLVEGAGVKGDVETWRTSLLTPGRQAAIVAEQQTFSRRTLTALMQRLESETFAADRVAPLGKALAELVLHPSIREALYESREEPIVVVHDTDCGRVPWETLTIRRWQPAAHAGLSRRYAASNLPLAKFSARQRADTVLSVLLIVNPTEDLAGAAREGQRVRELFRGRARTRLTTVEGRAATCARVAKELESGEYDVAHYAGHAAYRPERPQESGLTCSDGTLRGVDVESLMQLPPLIVFNACESGRVRGRRLASRMAANISLAEALLRGGVANYVGTYWPVGDAAAEAFADVFYAAILAEASIGTALLAARRRVRDLQSADWADYMHYGDPEFKLKELEAAQRSTR